VVQRLEELARLAAVLSDRTQIVDAMLTRGITAFEVSQRYGSGEVAIVIFVCIVKRAVDCVVRTRPAGLSCPNCGLKRASTEYNA
jgi:hypothetical protein